MHSGTVICFAVPHEAALLRKHTSNRPDLRLHLTGIGKRNAEASIRKLLAEVQPRSVISSGFAGALSRSLSVGTVVFDADELPPIGRELSALGARPVRFHTTENVVITAKEKDRLRRTTGAEAVEMESEIIRKSCRDAGISSATIRVISDAADEDLPLDFNQCLSADHRFSYAKLFQRLAHSPMSVMKVIAFQKRLTHARKMLSNILLSLRFDREV